MKKGSKRVIPGFGLSLGVTLSVLSIVVLIPLASLVVHRKLPAEDLKLLLSWVQKQERAVE